MPMGSGPMWVATALRWDLRRDFLGEARLPFFLVLRIDSLPREDPLSKDILKSNGVYRSAKTTGCTITVDGGVKDAFPR